ncbi:MAG TPA: DUF4388 domain-containing protein [Nitrospirota bacterium]
MALEGTIKEFGLADIFQLLGLQKKTGTLFLTGPEGTVNVCFEDGMIVKTEDSVKRPKYLIGNIFLNNGRVSREKLYEAIEIQKSTGQKLGSIFITQGLINKDELREALAFQIYETVYRVFRWRGGDYKFYQDKVDYDRDTVVPIGAEQILMDGVRMLDEWPMIDRKLPDFEMVLKKDEYASDPLEKAEDRDIFNDYEDTKTSLSREARAVFPLVDGRKTVYEIIELSPMGEFDSCKGLVDLLDEGCIRRSDARPKGLLAEEVLPRQSIVRRKADISYLKYVFSVLAVLVILFQITGSRKLLGGTGPAYLDLKKAIALNQIERVDQAVRLYYFDYGSYPEKAESLKAMDYISGSDVIDPWDYPLSISIAGPGLVRVTSAGADSKFGTDDDINSNP